MKERILEPESMDPMEETEAYDRLVKAEQGDILDTCFALSVCRMGITSGKVLDIGTGTGMIPLKLARLNRNLQIIGLDSSANMLKLADRNLARSGLIDRVSYVQGDAKNLPFQGNSIYDLHYRQYILPSQSSRPSVPASILRPCFFSLLSYSIRVP